MVYTLPNICKQLVYIRMRLWEPELTYPTQYQHYETTPLLILVTLSFYARQWSLLSPNCS